MSKKKNVVALTSIMASKWATSHHGKGKGGGSFSCWTTHKPMAVGKHHVEGGNCGHPTEGSDLRVALDSHAATLVYPWQNPEVQSIMYPIRDMHAPESPEDFKAMVAWVAKQVSDGKRLHVGCIGGHGRTGMVLAALVREMTGNEDAIAYVREHYCKRAVESKVQVEFLAKHYGLKGASPTKTSSWYGSTGSSKAPSGYIDDPFDYPTQPVHPDSVLRVASSDSHLLMWD